MRLSAGLFTAFALAACQAKAPAPAASARPGAAGPVHLAGLWQQTLTRDGREPPMLGRTEICLGPSTAPDLAPLAAGLRNHACDRIASRRGPEGVELFTLRCELGEGGVSQIDGRFARLSATRFELSEQSATTGAALPALNGRHDLRLQGRWLGACPPGMSPGETTLAGGFKVNLARAAAAASAMFGGR